MGDIKAGVIIKTKFCGAGSKMFTGYVDYVAREEAARNDNLEKYNLYNEYMGNPEKTSGLFTSEKDCLSSAEKRDAKKIFEIAQEKDSLMWQTVISFDNRFLEQNGIYNSASNTLDENKIRDLTRGCMEKILAKENLSDSSYWTAAIHYNTDNIHIHVATVEPIPQRERIKEGRYKGQIKGTFKQESIQAGKRYIINNVMDNDMANKRINEIIRDNILTNLKRHTLYKDKDLAKKFMEIHSKMPVDKRTWNYSMNALKDIRPELDELTHAYLEKYHSQEFEELRKLLEDQENRYRIAYGVDANNQYSKNKLDDLYKRMGNTILKEMKDYDKELKNKAYEGAKKEAQAQKRDISEDDIKPYIKIVSNEEKSGSNKKNSSNSNKNKKSSSGSKADDKKGKTEIRFRHRQSYMHMIGTMEHLKRAMHDEWQHARNEYEYEMLGKEKQQQQEREKTRKNMPESPGDISY